MSDEIAIGTFEKGKYVLYTADSTVSEINKKFAARFGEQPGSIFRMFPGREIWAGPGRSR